MTPPILLTDIDNTLYDWAAFFAPSFRAMVHVLGRQLQVSEDSLYEEFRQVFARHGSLEYAFVVQELESVRALPTSRIADLVRNTRGAFVSVRKRHLRPYPGVEDTLRWLHDQGIIVVGTTNSPAYLAQKRLYELDLDSFFDGLVAWEGFEGRTHPATEGFDSRQRIRRKTRLKRVVPIPLSDCKPSTAHYVKALDAFGARIESAWAVGDSLHKDLGPAARLGVSTIWARYGSGFDPTSEIHRTLLRITPWDAKEISATHETNAMTPDHVIDNFAELKRIIPARKLSLFRDPE